ncbi:hypothetical protein B0H13DRAFT_2393659 [Mycena leptocephala]|nr:hypothetical protein B0H13DRAFT_2393659 [Mycena leptocephala]
MLPESFSNLNKILQYTTVAANALRDVAAATQIPFLESFCTLSLTVIPIVQATKFQKDRCLRMMEEVHQLLCALMSLCVDSDGIRSPKMLDQIAQCTLPLLIYFQDMLEAWNSKQELLSGALALDLVGHLGNINELILECMMGEDKSVWTHLGHTIITLELFSKSMLKGSTPLLQKLPPLIEATSDAALRWRYTSMILLDPPLNALVQDPDRVIEEGVQYYDEGTRPIGEAVDFYNVVARHYNSPEYRNLIKATEFNKRAFSLAQRAEDIHHQLESLDAEYVHAHALFASAAIDFLMQGDAANIASTLDAAKTAYMVCDSPRISLCSMLEAVLNLPFGDVENARATILECLSKSGVHNLMHGAMDTFRWAVVCFAWMQKAKDAYGTVQALRRFADIYLIMGTKLDIHHVRAECMVGIGDIMLRRGDNVQAKKMWAAAHPLFLRSPRPKDAQFVKEQLEQLAIRENDQHTHRTRHSQKGYNTASYQHIALPTTCASHNL